MVEKKSKYMWLLDAGHGGMHGGKYMTDPKDGKYFVHANGKIAYEGVTNRKIASLVMTGLMELELPFKQVHHDYLDSPTLGALQQKAINYQSQYGNCFLVSIHSNAVASTTTHYPGQKYGYGIEVITSPGETEADPVAEILYEELTTRIKRVNSKWAGRPDLSDGDHDKEMKLAMTTIKGVPSIIAELLFFDEPRQAEFLDSLYGQALLADGIVAAIKRVEGI